MDKSLIHYKANELLQNDSFLCWRLFPLESEDAFWTELIAENPGMQREIEKATKILKLVNLDDNKLSPGEKSEMLKAFKERINKKKRDNKRKRIFWLAGLAGAAVIFLTVLIDVFFDLEKPNDNMVVAGSIEDFINEKEIILILADDNVMFLEENADIRYLADGKILISDGENKQTTQEIYTEEVKFNKLIVPPGKRSFLTMEDGTKVWINSGTILEFPPLFQPEQREIRVNGEIYIEVARDESKPFYVNTHNLKVEVLGTRFNVHAYKEDNEHSVVLVEGKVAVDLSGKKVELKPDMMLMVSDGNVKMADVNVYDYISWKDGLLQYSGELLSTILRKLSRYYDIPIIYGEDIQLLMCDGKLVLFDDIRDVMETIYSTTPVEYTMEEGCIRIRKR